MRKRATMSILFLAFSLFLKASFVVVGDVRITHNDPLKRWANPRFLNLEREINLLKPDAVFIIGDLVYGYTEDRDELLWQWKGFVRALKILKSPYYLIPGNHEIFGEDYAERIYRKFAGPTHWAKVIDGALFIGLDTDEVGYEDSLSPSQMKFLKESLEKYRNIKEKYVLMHKPLWWEYQDRSLWRKIFHPLMVKYGVRAVFAGHYHEYEYMQRDGVKYIVTGGGGAEQTGEGFFGAFPHFILIQGKKFTVFGDRGIFPVDFVTRKNKERVKKFFQGIMPQMVPGKEVVRDFHFKNPFSLPLHFLIKAPENPPFSCFPSEIKAFLKPKQNLMTTVGLRFASNTLWRLLPPPGFLIEAKDEDGRLYYSQKFEFKIPDNLYIKKIFVGKPVKFTQHYALDYDFPKVFTNNLSKAFIQKTANNLLKTSPITSGYNGVFDLEKYIFPNKGVYVFVLAEIISKGNRMGEIALQSNKPMRIFFNGEEIYRRDRGGIAYLTPKLKKGRNFLLILFVQRGGAWNLRILKRL